jgi:hypothetical protein
MGTGRCLCGAVSYEVHGRMRDVLICHCQECRRWHGHLAACTAVARDDLVIHDRNALRWIRSPKSAECAQRGFCAQCGSSLFWDAPARPTISIAAGTLDPPTNLRVAGHWYVAQAGDYYELPEDGRSRYEAGGDAWLGLPAQ